MKTLIRIFVLVTAAAMITGCGSIISKTVVEQVDRGVTLVQAQHNPEQYAGKKVLWGGVIIGTHNLEKTSEIEVLETGLDYNDQPDFNEAASKGRFLIESERYLDANVYKEGKGITVAGRFDGVVTRRIDKMSYNYPVVKPIEMKLSDKIPQDFGNYPPAWAYPYWDPYSPYYPFSPFGPTYPYGPYPYRRHPFYPYP